MKLLDTDTINSLPALYSTEDIPCAEKQIVAKFFNPMGAGTWYIAEGSKQEDGDWLFFGYCDLGFGSPEWGYVSLAELESVKLPFGMGIERDIYFSPQTISL
jgi:hypothetical protein